MNYRDVSPGDIILIYGEMKRVERVDGTHLATRGPNDSLELWGWGEDHLEKINMDNILHLKSLGFIEKERNEDCIILELESDEYIVTFSNYIRKDFTLMEVKGTNEGNALIRTLNSAQSLFYKITGKELKLDL